MVILDKGCNGYATGTGPLSARLTTNYDRETRTLPGYRDWRLAHAHVHIFYTV
ncbi:MAG: hypothetical protein ISR62_09020 [Desulfobacteraceae bacterium]|nr:hypothetical protein [Desulfobacterales bacterium]MBL6968546.1 hypothetical protein [Desulfobacteraceae bacterium]